MAPRRSNRRRRAGLFWIWTGYGKQLRTPARPRWQCHAIGFVLSCSRDVNGIDDYITSHAENQRGKNIGASELRRRSAEKPGPSAFLQLLCRSLHTHSLSSLWRSLAIV